MGRYKNLAINTLIFGICNFTSKLLVFLMLPFYTSVMSKEEFGTADLISTIVGLLLPILSLSIAHGCMRYALDKSTNTKEIFSFGFKSSLISIGILIAAYPILIRIPIIQNYIWIFIGLFISQVFHTFFSLFARGIENVKAVGIAGVASSFIIVTSNIVLLFVLHLGVRGYLLSMIISNVAFSFIIFIMCRMHRLFTLDNNKQLNKEIIKYSVPIIPNTLSWWITHSINRYALNYFCSVGDVGLYSVASRVPTIIDTFRGIFVQAWQLSTITEYDKDDSVPFFNTIYKFYNVFLLLSCTILLLLTKFVASILYSNDFYEAWIFTPLLVAGVLFSSLVAFYTPAYLAHKQTNRLFLSTLLGAIASIVLNFTLIPWVGAIGASLSTVIANFLIFLYLHIDTRKLFSFRLGNIKYYISYIIILIQAAVITLQWCEPFGIYSILCSSIIFILNLTDVIDLFRSGISVINKRKK